MNNQVFNMGAVVNQEQRGLLEARVTDKEVQEALWAISGNKAPVPDGFGSQFFKDRWVIMQNEILAVVQ